LKTCKQQHFSFIQTPSFSFGRVAGAAALAGRETTHGFQQSGSSAGSTPRRDQVRYEMQSRHLVFGRPQGHFPVDVTSRTCLANLTRDIWSRGWKIVAGILSFQRIGWTIKVLRISQLQNFCYRCINTRSPVRSFLTVF